ncbi:HD domain-containing phosphohydrolase [Candidatus Magnetomonas plexicatena]|uniref:HD domain-containing phosphohydrolase n=1 Tax=Candidatus Magnetomonas plexicatena TaxID=2552947 RepID=UPI001C746F89|nr:HD domain-containing protein [Nitrospirales bacterium LBB_01]
MDLFNLRKFLQKKDTIKLIDTLTDSLGISVCIADSTDTVIYGADIRNHSGLPVTVNDTAVGWVYGQDTGKKAAIVSLLHHMVKTEIERKALATETLDKYNEITMLYDFVEKVNTFNVKEIANFLINQILEQIRADNVLVILKNEISGKLEIAAEYGTNCGTSRELPQETGLVCDVMLSGKAAIINDCRSDSSCVLGADNVNSMICAPLKAKEKTLGVVTASTSESYNYCADDLRFFCTLVSQAAFAIDNARLYESLKGAFIKTVHTLAETIEQRDPYTGGHTKRVMSYCIAIAETLGLSPKERERLELASVLHDIGKIGVSDNVLRKTSKLTDEEFEEIKTHPASGKQILSYIEELKDIIPGVKSHHERFDGKGYPEGLIGTDIDLIARIIAVADSFDAMTSDRPYRKGLPFEVAIDELRKCSGTQFDADVVEAFFKACDENKIKPAESGK